MSCDDGTPAIALAARLGPLRWIQILSLRYSPASELEIAAKETQAEGRRLHLVASI